MKLHLETGKSGFQPGESIDGLLVWSEAEKATHIDIRLVWYTSGKGTPDFEVVAHTVVASPAAQGEQAFSFVAPGYPHSFSGTLISVTWAIEAIVFPQTVAERLDLVIAPGAREILVGSVGPRKD